MNDTTNDAANQDTGRGLRWHYGPTHADPEPGKRWHEECGGEVQGFDGGDICLRCGAQSEGDEGQ